MSRAGHHRDPLCQYSPVLPAMQLPLSPPNLGSSASFLADLPAREVVSQCEGAFLPMLLFPCRISPALNLCFFFLFLTIFCENLPVFQNERHSARVQEVSVQFNVFVDVILCVFVGEVKL